MEEGGRAEQGMGGRGICAGGVDIGRPVAGVGVGQDTEGAEQPEQVIDQEGAGGDQATPPSGGNVLMQAILQWLGLAFAGQTDDAQVNGAG
jgi:hypothetical protein